MTGLNSKYHYVDVEIGRSTIGEAIPKFARGHDVNDIVVMEVLLHHLSHYPKIKAMANWFLDEPTVYPWNRRVFSYCVEDKSLSVIRIIFNNSEDAVKFKLRFANYPISSNSVEVSDIDEIIYGKENTPRAMLSKNDGSES